MAKKKNVNPLNIFLIKEKYKQRDHIIKENACSDPFEVPISGLDKGYLYIKRGQGKYPKWSSLFQEIIDIKLIGKTTNVSAVLLLISSGRHFALAFGQGGRFLLKDDVFEERFGLLVALNSVDKESLRCIDKQSLDSIESQTRIQSGYATSADQFGLDVEQDMLKAIVGAPKDPRLGTRITGTDSLSVSVRMDLSDLHFLLNAYREKFEEDISKKDYEWVNNISIVKRPSSLIAELDFKLLEKFEKKDYANLWLSIPEIIQWDLVKGFTYTNGRKVIHPDINLEGFLKTVQDADITIELLKSRRVQCADEDHNPVFKSWPIYKCLYAEIDLGKNKYILNDGKWFNVNVDFVTKTNAEYKKIEKSKLILPEYCGGGEGKYNSYISEDQPDKYALLDDKNKIFHGGGHGQVEVCDLFSKEKRLIHVKIYGKSSVLSHLFSQGFVSGQLIQLDSEFREKVKNKLPESFQNLITIEKRPEEQEFTITFAVISVSEGNDLYLPFFSRVNLNNTAKILLGFGYKVELLKIHVDEKYAKTKICAPGKSKKLA